MFKAFLKDSLIYVIPSFLSKGIALILIPFYTRVLSPADYGAMDLLFAFTNLINLTVALEVSQGVARFYGTEQASGGKASYFSSALFFTIVCYTLFALIASGFTEYLSPKVMGNEGLESSFKIGLVCIWIGGLFYLIHNQFRWELRSKLFAYLSIINLLVTFSVSFLMTYILDYGLNGMLIGQASGSFVGVAIGIFNLKQSLVPKVDIQRLKNMLKFSIPLVPSGIAVFVNSYVDRLVISHYLTVSDVGLFGIGFRVASVTAIVLAGFQGAITPLIYANYQDSSTPQQLARIFRMFLAFALLVFISLTVFANDILEIVTTPEYYSASSVIVFLVPAILLSQMYIFAPGIAISRKTQYFFYINIAGAVLNTVLNILLVPSYGIIGAASATLVNYIVVFSLYIVISQRFYFIPHHWRNNILSMVCAGLLVITFTWLDYDLFILKILFVSAGAGVIFGFKLIQVSEIVDLYSKILKKIR